MTRAELRKAAADNAAPLVLAAIAFGGSFDHWVHLASQHGQHGVLAPAIAVCVDLGVYMATRERQRDARIGRGRRGWMSWPTLVLIGGIVLTLAGNVASAQPTPWGITTALIPGAMLLVAISLMERRAAEDGRQALAAEARRQAEAAAERHRQAELDAERERQETARLEAEAAAQRHAERQADLAARRAAIVTPASVTGGPLRGLEGGHGALAITAGHDGPVSATDVMRDHWDAAVAAGRVPTGAELLRVAGLSPTSSLGRQLAARWRTELDAAEPEPEGARA